MDLRLDAIALRLGEKAVLRGASFELSPGEVVGLLGPNGAGKTTLLRVATGVLAPDAGEVLLGGQPLAGLSRRARARTIAVVPQQVEVPFPFRAGELVLMGRAPHQRGFSFESREDIAHALSAMDRLGIASLADRPIFELSGGERQLVVLARAFAQQSELLLLDEPTSFLDLRHRVLVLRAVREFAAAGGGALVVSHDLGLASRICDRLVLLADGRVVAQGAAAEVLRPDILAAAYGIETDVLSAPDGSPLVVPRIRSS